MSTTQALFPPYSGYPTYPQLTHLSPNYTAHKALTPSQQRRHCPSNTAERQADIVPLLTPGTERRIHYPWASPA